MRLVALATVLVALAFPGTSHAFTTRGAAGGRLVGPGLTAPNGISDGAGGIIVAARDPSTGSTVVNRYSSAGQSLWNQGISYPATSGVQIESDGHGGAIVGVQSQETTTTMTVARILSSGATTWQATFPNGVLAAGGNGGAWVISQSGELYADGITSDGTISPRVRLTFSPESESLPAVIGDGSGGVYFSWRIARDDGTFGLDLQHLAVDGTLWPAPALVAGTTESGVFPTLASDGRGGVLISWYAAATYWTNDYGVAGTPLWDRVLTLRTPSARSALVTADGAGGAFVAWTERLRQPPRATDLLNVTYVGDTGAAHWTRQVAVATGGVLDLRVAAQRGAIVVGWQVADIPVAGSALDPDLYVQRVESNGSLSYGSALTRLASSLGPDSFGSLVDGGSDGGSGGGSGSVLAVFTQAPCLRSDVSGVALQRIGPDGARAFRADGACP